MFLTKILIFLLLVSSFNVYALWLDTTSQVQNIITYATSNKILVSLKNANGADVVACSNRSQFIISSTDSEEARNRMYSMLLAAQMSGSSVTISYSKVGNCEAWGNTPNVYRRITRLTL